MERLIVRVECERDHFVLGDYGVGIRIDIVILDNDRDGDML